MKCFLCCAALIIILPGINLRAQDATTINSSALIPLEVWEQGNDLDEVQLEDLQDFIESNQPFKLNDSLERMSLLDYGLISPLQKSVLDEHIRKYGPLLHVYELKLTGVFEEDWLRNWAPFLSFGPSISHRASGKTFSALRVSSSSRCRWKSPDSAWRLRTYTRARMKLFHSFDAAAVIGKDRGESFRRPGRVGGPEHFSAFFRYRSDHVIRQIILGSYRIQGGAGLRYGQGWASWNPDYPLADAFSPFRLRGATSSTGGTLFNGLAAELRNGSMRMNLSHGVVTMDGYAEPSGDNIEWRGNTDYLHDKPAFLSRRGRSSLSRSSVRIGMEKEWLRMGWSLDVFDQKSIVSGDSMRWVPFAAKLIGMDVQLIRKGNVLWIEHVLHKSGWGTAFALNTMASGWLSICTGGQVLRTSMPVAETHTLLSDARPSESWYFAMKISWGKGWTLRAGVRMEDEREYIHETTRSARMSFRLMRSSFSGARHSVSSAIIFPEKYWTSTQDVTQMITRARISYRFSSLGTESATWSGGLQLSAGREGSETNQGLAWFIASLMREPYKGISWIRLGLGMHSSDHADHRAYFWFTGAEGRVVMHQLYHRGWRASLSMMLQLCERWKIYPGALYSVNMNGDSEKGSNFEIGLRVVYRAN